MRIFNLIEGVWGQNGGWAFGLKLPLTIYFIKIEMARGYNPFCKKLI